MSEIPIQEPVVEAPPPDSSTEDSGRADLWSARLSLVAQLLDFLTAVLACATVMLLLRGDSAAAWPGGIGALAILVVGFGVRVSAAVRRN